jgi:hypothetical protein
MSASATLQIYRNHVSTGSSAVRDSFGQLSDRSVLHDESRDHQGVACTVQAPLLPAYRTASNVDIGQMSLRRLRRAIQENEISFPAQVPIFPKQSRADIQWKLVDLYFVRNWSPSGIGRRYQMTSERVRQVIAQWVRRAAVLGYLQEVYQEVYR